LEAGELVARFQFQILIEKQGGVADEACLRAGLGQKSQDIGSPGSQLPGLHQGQNRIIKPLLRGKRTPDEEQKLGIGRPDAQASFRDLLRALWVACSQSR
jgi:hypothetical protein